MSNEPSPEIKDWFIRIGDGRNFKNSKVWSINSKNPNGKHFLKKYSIGDRIWFLTNVKAGRLLYAVGTITSVCDRIKGPLIEQTNADLGWTEGEWGDKELHYNDCYLINELKLQPDISIQNCFILYNPSKCKIKDLYLEYQNICKYSVCKKR
jgi:hypothetical protein